MVQVQVRHESMIKRKLKVKGLTEAGADRMTFFNEEAKRQTIVQEYYQQRYNYTCDLPYDITAASLQHLCSITLIIHV